MLTLSPLSAAAAAAEREEDDDDEEEEDDDEDDDDDDEGEERLEECPIHGGRRSTELQREINGELVETGIDR